MKKPRSITLLDALLMVKNRDEAMCLLSATVIYNQLECFKEAIRLSIEHLNLMDYLYKNIMTHGNPLTTVFLPLFTASRRRIQERVDAQLLHMNKLIDECTLVHASLQLFGRQNLILSEELTGFEVLSQHKCLLAKLESEMCKVFANERSLSSVIDKGNIASGETGVAMHGSGTVCLPQPDIAGCLTKENVNCRNTENLYSSHGDSDETNLSTENNQQLQQQLQNDTKRTEKRSRGGENDDNLCSKKRPTPFVWLSSDVDASMTDSRTRLRENQSKLCLSSDRKVNDDETVAATPTSLGSGSQTTSAGGMTSTHAECGTSVTCNRYNRSETRQ